MQFRPTTTNYFRTTGSKGDEYHLEILANDVHCSCPGFTYRRRCKHQTALIEQLELKKE